MPSAYALAKRRNTSVVRRNEALKFSLLMGFQKGRSLYSFN
ncbi:hypothetical protein LEP1GSC192_1751 [Leptospira sp. B5-022]|nr:hypothetical protein LEP1GSC192_1751 [Leptospira sp. B5-022]